MIDKGMDNEKGVLQGLVDKANTRIAGLKSGDRPALIPDANAKYSAEFVVDLDQIIEPMIADPDVNNEDVSKRYTHDTIRPISFYGGEKAVDLGFVGSCMIHKGDMKIISQMLKNIERQQGTVEFKAPLVVAPPTYNIVDELKEEGDWEVLQSTPDLNSMMKTPRASLVQHTKNMMYLERPGCNLCMGNREKAEKGDTVMATSLVCSRVAWLRTVMRRRESPCWHPPQSWSFSTILGRTPNLDEYISAVEGIDLTSYAPPA